MPPHHVRCAACHSKQKSERERNRRRKRRKQREQRSSVEVMIEPTDANNALPYASNYKSNEGISPPSQEGSHVNERKSRRRRQAQDRSIESSKNEWPNYMRILVERGGENVGDSAEMVRVVAPI